MSRPPFRLTCCLCGRLIPTSSEAWALDEEWQRRHPAKVGVLACTRCAVQNNYFSCRDAHGRMPDGHRPPTAKPWARDNCDSWHHIEAHRTHIGMVQRYPQAGLQQGAEQYLRRTAQRRESREGLAQVAPHSRLARRLWLADSGVGEGDFVGPHHAHHRAAARAVLRGRGLQGNDRLGGEQEELAVHPVPLLAVPVHPPLDVVIDELAVNGLRAVRAEICPLHGQQR